MLKTDKYVLSVIEKLKLAQDNSDVERIITVAIEGIRQTAYKGMMNSFVLQLQIWLDNLSPLHWSSTQWGCLRYASIHLREYLMEVRPA